MNKPKPVFIEIALPSYWASYLINNDASGLDSQDLAECKERTKDLTVVSVAENEYCARFNGLLTMVANYTILTQSY